MNLKQKVVALSVVIASSLAATAIAMPQISATPGKNGAWVQVQKNGQPVADAIVNENFITDSSGRVFVYNNRISSNADFSVVTPDGEIAQTRAFLGRNRGGDH